MYFLCLQEVKEIDLGYSLSVEILVFKERELIEEGWFFQGGQDQLKYGGGGIVVFRGLERFVVGMGWIKIKFFCKILQFFSIFSVSYIV